MTDYEYAYTSLVAERHRLVEEVERLTVLANRLESERHVTMTRLIDAETERDVLRANNYRVYAALIASPNDSDWLHASVLDYDNTMSARLMRDTTLTEAKGTR